MASPLVEGPPENIQKHQNTHHYQDLNPILEQNVNIIPEETLRRISLGSMKSFLLQSEDYP